MNVSSHYWSPFRANDGVFSRNEKQKVYSFFFQLQRARHNSLRAACAKKAMQDLSRLQNSRERDKKNNLTRSNNLTLCRKKLPFILGFLKK